MITDNMLWNEGEMKLMRWLHLSDLHIKDNADWNIYVDDLKQCCIHNGPIDLVVVTGDFHDYKEKSDFSKSASFLKQLMKDLQLDINKDLFMVPGNHDGSHPIIEHKEAFARNIKNNFANYDQKEWEELMSQFQAYEQFVHELIKDYPEKHPANVHCRKWRNKINFLHLNSAIVADGKAKDDQMVDVNAMVSQEFPEDMPTIILVHNHFNDLHEEHQKRIRGVMRNKYISAYFCGDKHRQGVDQIAIRNTQNQQIPCIISYKSATDAADQYSRYGVIIGCWEDSQAMLKGWTWNIGEGFKVDPEVTEQTIDMKKAYEETGGQLSGQQSAVDNAEDTDDLYELEDSTMHSEDRQWLFRKYYHNMSETQIDELNRQYAAVIYELSKDESNERLKVYVQNAMEKGCLTEVLNSMKRCFEKERK